MKRPKITDKEIERYVDFLEGKLRNFESKTILVNAYIALSKFIGEGNKVLSSTTINSKNFTDKDDKIVERAQKFAKEIPEYLRSLEDMEKKIEPKVLEEIKKESASDYESYLIK